MSPLFYLTRDLLLVITAVAIMVWIRNGKGL